MEMKGEVAGQTLWNSDRLFQHFSKLQDANASQQHPEEDRPKAAGCGTRLMCPDWAWNTLPHLFLPSNTTQLSEPFPRQHLHGWMDSVLVLAPSAYPIIVADLRQSSSSKLDQAHPRCCAPASIHTHPGQVSGRQRLSLSCILVLRQLFSPFCRTRSHRQPPAAASWSDGISLQDVCTHQCCCMGASPALESIFALYVQL